MYALERGILVIQYRYIAQRLAAVCRDRPRRLQRGGALLKREIEGVPALKRGGVCYDLLVCQLPALVAK